MKFFEIIETLPREEKQALRRRITTACMIEPPTWYSWMTRKIIPKPSQKIISIELKQDIETLFPNN